MEAETDIRYGDMLKTRCMRGLLDFARFSFSVKSGGERLGFPPPKLFQNL